MMETKIPLSSGDEYDAFSRTWRRLIGWKSGTVKAVKNGYRRRLRREHREEIRQELVSYTAEERA